MIIIVPTKKDIRKKICHVLRKKSNNALQIKLTFSRIEELRALKKRLKTQDKLSLIGIKPFFLQISR